MTRAKDLLAVALVAALLGVLAFGVPALVVWQLARAI